MNPLLYTYGLAFFAALMLASRARWSQLLLGAAILVPFQGWGIGFDFLAQVGAKLGPDVAARAGLLGAPAEAIALAYHLPDTREVEKRDPLHHLVGAQQGLLWRVC